MTVAHVGGIPVEEALAALPAAAAALVAWRAAIAVKMATRAPRRRGRR